MLKWGQDFFYVCPAHLKDKGFCSPIVDEAAVAARKKKEMDAEIERVKKEFEEKQKKKEKEKEKDKKKAKDKKDDDKKEEKKPEDKVTCYAGQYAHSRTDAFLEIRRCYSSNTGR